MLKSLGLEKMDDLFQSIPASVPQHAPNLPAPCSEAEVLQEALRLSQKNLGTDRYLSFLGAGAYDHYIPSAVGHLIGRSEFYTAYTPYQPELSQGTLQSIYEFQTMICQLTGMEVANASMYDGASALAEAALMAMRITKKHRLLLSPWLHPHYRQVLETYLSGLSVELVEAPSRDYRIDPDAPKSLLTDDTAALLMQSPNFLGFIEDLPALGSLLADHPALLVTAVNPISLGLLISPGESHADIAVGEGQPLGLPLSFGGPYFGFFATRQKYVRQLPGRLVGATHDAQGQTGYVLTLQTREQHIRREKATSNICSNQALCALAATIYLSLLGKEGLREVAERNMANSHYLAEQICEISGFEPLGSAPFFNEFPLRVPVAPEEINRKLLEQGIIGGLVLGRYFPELDDCLLFCATETKSVEDLDHLAEVLEGATRG